MTKSPTEAEGGSSTTKELNFPAPPETLRAKLWRSLRVGGAQVLKTKEMREACAFYDACRKDIRAASPDLVVDVCGGHGALGLLCLVHGAASRLTVVDPHRPPSHNALKAAWTGFLGESDGSITYELHALRDSLPRVLGEAKVAGLRTYVMACHACQHLAKDIIDICLTAGCPFAVCPCCPKDVSGSIQAAASTLSIDFGAAMVLAEMGRIGSAGWDVRLRTFDADVSPLNRVLVARPNAGAATSSAVREEKLQKAYERAHRRPDVVGGGSGATKLAVVDGATATTDYAAQLQLKVDHAATVLGPLACEGLLDGALLKPPRLQVRESPPRHFRARTIVSVGGAGSKACDEAGASTQSLFQFVRKEGVRWTLVTNLPVDTLAESIAASLPLMADLLSDGQRAAGLAPGLTCVKLHTTVGRADRQQLLACFVYARGCELPSSEELERARNGLMEALVTSGMPCNVILVAQARGVHRSVPEGHEFVDEELAVAGRTLRYRQPFGQFSNPNPYMAVHTAEWLLDSIQSTLAAGVPQTDLLELYCGAGSHTVVLAPIFRHVLAVEINRHLVDAAQRNVTSNNLDNVTVVRAPSEEFCKRVIRRRTYVLKATNDKPELNLNFGCTILDPPRAGLDALTVDAVQGYPQLLYISCNPEALKRDLSALLVTHELCAVVVLDHFPFSAHSELAVHLRLRVAVAATAA